MTRPAALPANVNPRNDQYDDDTYREEETEDRGGFPYYRSWGWGAMGGLWPTSGRREEETGYDEDSYEDAGDSSDDEDDSGSLWDEGLYTLLIVGGTILFLFPEPATSGVGVLLIAMGVIGWIIDWAL